jgi:signal peptidase I
MNEIPAQPVMVRRRRTPWILWVSATLGGVLTVGLIGFSAFYRPYTIPSGAMVPTLEIGDYVLTTAIGPDQVKRGDVLIFKDTKDNQTDYVKRLIGLPGDRIQVVDGFVYLNDKLIPQEAMARPAGEDPFSTVSKSRERLPDSRGYVIQDTWANGGTDNTGVFLVPEGHYFFMGDNRDNSADSRVTQTMGGIGYVPAANIRRKVTLVVFNSKGVKDRSFKTVE